MITCIAGLTHNLYQNLRQVIKQYQNADLPRESHNRDIRQSRATESEIHELVSQVSKELSPWGSGITLDMVEKLYCLEDSSDTVRIQASKLSTPRSTSSIYETNETEPIHFFSDLGGTEVLTSSFLYQLEKLMQWN